MEWEVVHGWMRSRGGGGAQPDMERGVQHEAGHGVAAARVGGWLPRVTFLLHVWAG